MPKPNYQFEKRQKDLAKKQKQEEKRLKKLADKATDTTAEATSADAGGPTEATPDGGTGSEA